MTSVLSFSQGNLNIELLSNTPIPTGENGNDCWGFVDANGLEYAIIGSTQATYIYSLEDPTAPILRSRIEGVTSTWRDIKDHGDYLYVTADVGAEGLLVIDMSGAPTNITSSFYLPEITIGNQTAVIGRSHNLYITESGLMVLSGGNQFSGRPLFFDLNVDPEEPPFIGASRNVYAHDVYAENNILYSSDIFTGELTVHDYTDPADIQVFSSVATTTTFTHNAWPTDDDASVFTTDERAGAFVDAYDVSNPTMINFLDKFRPEATFETESIPHNTHVLGDFLATSWYRDGVVLTDISRPNNMVQVGIYDTFAGEGDGFDGCWGTYPFLPSGLLIASDINAGLFVFQPTYERGGYFEGTVIDSATREVLSGVDVNFDDRKAQADVTDLNGNFETGIYQEDDYPVTFSLAGYETKTVNANITRGVVNTQTIELVAINQAVLSVRVLDPNGIIIPGADFQINFLGQVAGDRLEYEIIAGRWGFITNSIPSFIVDEGATETIEITLEPGIYDDFVFDFGWTENGTATTGRFERGAPASTVFNGQEAQLGFDFQGDFGTEAYVTGNTGGGAGDDDVDNGTTTITSPVFDMSSESCAKLEFYYHFFNEGGGVAPDDELIVMISNGTSTVVIDTFTETTTTYTRYESGSLADLLDLTDNMTISFETSDPAANGHIVEAIIDRVTVSDFDVSFTESIDMLAVDFMNTSESSTVISWDFGDGNTSTMENPMHVYAAPGNYTVTLTVETPCGVQTFVRNVLVEMSSSTNTPLASLGISIIQNPVQDVLTVRNTGRSAVELQLFNAVGQAVMNYNLSAGNTWNANVADLPVGTYFLSALNEEVTPITVSVAR